MAEVVTFSPAVSIIGWGALSKLPSVLGSKGFQRVVIVTDPIVGKSGIVGRVVDLLKRFTDVQRVQEVGLGKEDAKKLYENVLIQTRRIKTNPRPLDDEQLSYVESGIPKQEF